MSFRRVGDDWLAQAQQAAGPRNGSKQARASYQLLVREAPFHEPGMLAAAAYYTSHREYQAAYDALRVGLTENPRSLPLLKAYALAAADAGLTEYAGEALAQLRKQLPAAAYANLAADFAARRAARAAASASFSVAPATPLPQ